ncbi:putitive LPS biosynthesis protein [alpha proteobacterium U9-1i]|nr:putitive LPS biosynthesis protein [alpha proteobacterium U9-1i]
MDTTDPEITFDAGGICSHCHGFDRNIRPHWKPNAKGADELSALLDVIKTVGANKPYDCIIGLSGGVDSSFLAVKIVEWGLRPLVVHVDAGWNSELAVKNIEQIITGLGLHLDTEVIDWHEMRDLQRAFLRSHVANQDIPQDHAFTSALVKKALQHEITYVISGNNFATEGVLPQSWGYDSMDATHIRDIHRKFGEAPLRSFPILGFHDYYVTMLQKLRFVAPLNLIAYDKTAAIALLEKSFGWRYYGGKHYESVWTRWYQAHYLPAKFGYDKRKAHLSSLIVAGTMTRDEALAELERPLYTDNELATDTAFVAKKLGFGDEEFAALVHAPPRHYQEFRTNEGEIRRHKWAENTMAQVRAFAERVKAIPRGVARRARGVLAR